MTNSIVIITLSMLLIIIIVSWYRDRKSLIKKYRVLVEEHYYVQTELHSIRTMQRRSSKKYYNKMKRLATEKDTGIKEIEVPPANIYE